MKKKLTILFVLISFTLFSQTIEKTGDRICECINNNNEEIVFSEKFNDCYAIVVIKNMTLEEKIANDTKAIEIKYNTLKKYIKNNCVQKVSKKNISTVPLYCITEEACNCINNISYGLIHLKDSIDVCINENILKYYKKQLVNDETTSEFNAKKKVIDLKVDKNAISFYEVEVELARKCKKIKDLNKKHKKTISFSRKKRQTLVDTGLKLTKNNKHNKALKYFKKYTEKFKDDAEGYYGLGEALMHNNQNEKALKMLIKSYKMDEINRFHRDIEYLISQVFINLKAENKINIAKKIMNENNIRF